jgi:hypothetical protein
MRVRMSQQQQWWQGWVRRGEKAPPCEVMLLERSRLLTMMVLGPGGAELVL